MARKFLWCDADCSAAVSLCETAFYRRRFAEGKAQIALEAAGPACDGILRPASTDEFGELLGTATASLASVRPGTPYEFSFPTKLGSTAAGVPLVFAGAGPAIDFVQTQVDGIVSRANMLLLRG